MEPGTGSNIMGVLKERTRLLHGQVESHLGVMDPGLTLTRYRSLLVRLWGFYAPLEARLDELQPWAALGLAPGPRRKSPWLARDLDALGVNSGHRGQLPVCARLPGLDGIADAIGCLYVLEGATLGGAIIGRRLASTLGIGPESAGAFFASYGRERGPMWKAFGAAVSEYGGRREPIIGAACETFASLDEWLTSKPT